MGCAICGRVWREWRGLGIWGWGWEDRGGTEGGRCLDGSESRWPSHNGPLSLVCIFLSSCFLKILSIDFRSNNEIIFYIEALPP
jgi:hypothetical protein